MGNVKQKEKSEKKKESERFWFVSALVECDPC